MSINTLKFLLKNYAISLLIDYKIYDLLIFLFMYLNQCLWFEVIGVIVFFLLSGKNDLDSDQRA